MLCYGEPLFGRRCELAMKSYRRWPETWFRGNIFADLRRKIVQSVEFTRRTSVRRCKAVASVDEFVLSL